MQGLKCLVKVLSLAALSAVATPFVLNAQSDPGVRGGAAGAGGPFQASRKVRRTSSISSATRFRPGGRRAQQRLGTAL